MNSDMIGGIIRAVLSPALAYAVGVGILPAADYGPVVLGIITLATAIWSIRTNSTGKVIK